MSALWIQAAIGLVKSPTGEPRKSTANECATAVSITTAYASFCSIKGEMVQNGGAGVGYSVCLLIVLLTALVMLAMDLINRSRAFLGHKAWPRKMYRAAKPTAVRKLELGTDSSLGLCVLSNDFEGVGEREGEEGEEGEEGGEGGEGRMEGERRRRRRKVDPEEAEEGEDKRSGRRQ